MTVATRRISLSAAGVAAIHGFALTLVNTASFARNPAAIGVGLTLDLTVTASFLVYLLAIRPGHLPSLALLPIFAAGVLTARAILPPDSQLAVTVAGAAMGLVELGAAALLIVRGRRVAGRYRVARLAGATRRDALAAGIEVALGSRALAAFLATEIAVLGMALSGWFRRAPRDEGTFFAVHRRRGWTIIAATLAFLAAVETAGVHLLLARVSPVAAWVVTALSMYALIWLAGDMHAIRLAGIRVEADVIDVTVGLRWRARIPRAAIRSIQAIEAKLPRAHDLAACELLWPNVCIELNGTVEMVGPFGIRKHVSRITLTCDRRNDFLAGLGPLPDRGQAL